MPNEAIKSAVILANPRTADYMVGGAENQLIQLGIELAKRNINVTLAGTVEHIDSNKEPFAYERIPGNWARPRAWLRLFISLRRLRPNILVIRVLNPLLPVYGMICLLLGIKLYYFCAHDWEIESRKDKRIKGWRLRLFWLGVQFVDRLYVQNSYQFKGFRRILFFRKNRVEIIRNIPMLKPVNRPKLIQEYFTWIGSYRPHKRPEWVIEIAKRLPEHHFMVILDTRHFIETREIFQNASNNLENLIFVAGVRRDELPEIYEKSKAVLITSKGEGFPNVAIEAWSQGCPVISTINNALLDFEDGESTNICKDIDEFVELIKHTKASSWGSFGEKAIKLFTKEFNTQEIVNRIVS